jgi:DNA-binding transcriptional regulator YhcF (GntR family)
LKTATREELVQFVKKQNTHIKQMESILTKKYEEKQKQMQQEIETLNRFKLENEELRKLLQQKNQGSSIFCVL